MIAFWLSAAGLLLLVMVFLLRAVRGQRAVVVTMALTIPILTVLAYSHFGASNQVAEYVGQQKKMAEVQDQIKRLGSRDNIIAMLKKRVAANPSNPKGWYLLAKLSLGGGDTQQAITYYQKTLSLAPDNNDAKVGLAEATFYQNKGRLNTNTRKLLQEVIHQDKQNLPAISLLAASAYQQQHYREALDYWQQILPYLDPQSETGQSVMKMMAEARRKLK